MPRFDHAHFGAEQTHPKTFRRLPAHVFLAHVDDAIEPKQRADGGGRHAVLARAGLGDDAPLAHALREQPWPSALLILCAPVWSRSSRFRKMRAPRACSVRPAAKLSGVGRPE